MVLLKPEYIPLTQQKYCCIPTCIQMILLRKNLKLYSQEEIGAKLGLVIPKKLKHLFSNIVKTGKKPKRGYGTREVENKFHLNKFFIAKNISLRSTRVRISESQNPKKLIETNLRKGNDIIVIYNNKGIDKRGKSFGHGCLISEIKNNEVSLINPSSKKEKKRFCFIK